MNFRAFLYLNNIYLIIYIYILFKIYFNFISSHTVFWDLVEGLIFSIHVLIKKNCSGVLDTMRAFLIDNRFYWPIEVTLILFLLFF